VTNKRRTKGKLPPFVPVIRTTLASPAWKQLSFGARALYVVLRSYLRFDNLNNGKVFRSYREAAADLGTSSKRSIHRWFCELEHYGFIIKTTGACLGVDGDGIAAHWRLTECSSYDAKGTQIAATRDFERWDGTLFNDAVKTESRTPNEGTPPSKGGHTDTVKSGSVCPQKGDIDSAASMSSKGGHNCLPLPQLPKHPARRAGAAAGVPEGGERSAPAGSAVASEPPNWKELGYPPGSPSRDDHLAALERQAQERGRSPSKRRAGAA
jgi:hypothetical protein